MNRWVDFGWIVGGLWVDCGGIVGGLWVLSKVSLGVGLSDAAYSIVLLKGLLKQFLNQFIIYLFFNC